MCGGAMFLIPHLVKPMGPSPRVRGSRHHRGEPAAEDGSIPACAGEPTVAQVRSVMIGVHPRVCGGAFLEAAWITLTWGPSPRVRGSPFCEQRQRLGDGSIPACAGEPRNCEGDRNRTPVHPRVCGGAPVSCKWSNLLAGPSPRVRGSRSTLMASQVYARSIPACAGEPLPPALLQVQQGVHPRVCGGALRCDSCMARKPGPSPRVRGSLCQIVDRISVSIQLSMSGDVEFSADRNLLTCIIREGPDSTAERA